MPDDSADQIFEDFQDIVQQAILQGFPNPERKGCPGTEVLRAFANRPRPAPDAAWEHVTHCSPCYKEFLDLRSQVKSRLKLERRQAFQRRAALLGVVALAFGVFAGYEFLHHGTGGLSPEADEYESARLDLRGQSPRRNAAAPNETAEPLTLPPRRLKLTILLPIGSEPGHYEVQFLDNSVQPVVNTAGEAHVEQGTTNLAVTVDLRGRAAQVSRIAVRRPPSEWASYSVTVR